MGLDERRIVELFVDRQPFYNAEEVRRLTGLPDELLDEALRDGSVEPITEGGAARFVWEDVANLALQHWTPRQIARTLERAGFPDALPSLNQVRVITVELPVYQIRLLHELAEEKSLEDASPRNVSDALEYELAALATDYTAAMEKHIPGFEAAALFPGAAAAHQLPAARCVYCGGPVTTGSEACPACLRRHVPTSDSGT